MGTDCQTIFVTGGAGFIGSHVVRALLSEASVRRVINFDALTYAGNRKNLEDLAGDDRHRFVRGDIRDRAAVTAALAGCDAVVHLAAESHVDRSVLDAAPFVSTNVLGTQTLVDACREIGGVMRFVHVGTDEVYGSLPLNDATRRFTESSPLQPRSPYAASKASADLLVLAAHATWGLPVIVTRCSNNFGPHQYPEKVIPRFITNLLEGRKVPLYGDGLNVRDWIHVRDHAEALVRILAGGRCGEIYNIGAHNEQSNLALTHAILGALDVDESMIEYVADRPGHDRRYALDALKLRAELNWTPQHSRWPEALHATVAWYREHESWWRPLVGNRQDSREET